MNIGENIYNYRTGKGMSQTDLANALEVSRQSVSKWENNSAIPDLERIIKMSELFDVTLDELVFGKKIETKKRCLLRQRLSSPSTSDPELWRDH